MSKLWPSGVVAALVLLSVPAFAQTETPPAYVAILDGDVTLVREAQSVNAIVNMPIVAGDRLTTTAGRVEVLYPDGTALDLDERTNVDFGGEGRIRLSSGRAILVVPAGTNARYEIDTSSGAVVSRGPGRYRADAAGASTWALTTRTNNSDGFEGWSDALRAARTTSAASPSAEHLPQELQPYDSTLDQNGTWQYAPTYGYVWYPRVESDWRPYYEGSWSPVPSYGWTWVGVHRWEYPTHHYGRWGYANNRWFWIPGRAYSPAWVEWGYASDYVSWCPLGIDSRPVFAMTVGYGNPWAGWTVVSKSHFGGRGYVPRFAVAPHQMPAQTPFVVQHSAPSIAPRADTAFPTVNSGAGIAVPRGTRTQPAARQGVAVPRSVPPTPTAPTPASPQTVLPTTTAPATPQPEDRRPPRSGRRPNESAPSAPANPGDNPAYAPRYAPRTTTPPATAPAPSTSPATPPVTNAPPETAAPRNAPAAGGGGGGTAPRSAPAAGSAQHSSGSGATAPAQKPAPDKKPADNAKAKGRGGL